MFSCHIVAHSPVKLSDVGHFRTTEKQNSVFSYVYFCLAISKTFRDTIFLGRLTDDSGPFFFTIKMLSAALEVINSGEVSTNKSQQIKLGLLGSFAAAHRQIEKSSDESMSK